MPIKRTQIVEVARTYIGTPFHHQGRLKGVGIDCVGLLVCVAKELGIPHFDFTNYPRIPDGVTLTREIAKSCDPIDIRLAEPGDILIFRMGRHPRHVGIRTDHGMIHTNMQVGKVVEHVLDKKWSDALCGAMSYRGVE